MIRNSRFLKEISGMSEEGPCTRSGGSIFVPKISEVIIKKPGTSIEDVVQW